MQRSFTLDDLIALNDEISSLVRARIPLDQGLRLASKDLDGSLGRVTGRLAERIGQGESLPTALAAERVQIPPVYRAVVEAGMRSGRLAAALEGMASSARRLAELRGAVRNAMLYPLVLVVVASVAFWYWLKQVMPDVLAACDGFQISLPAAFTWVTSALGWLNSLIPLPAFPALVLVFVLVWWRQSGRALVVQSGFGGRWLGWVPGASSLQSWTRGSVFADLLSLLVEQEVPLHEGIELAASATGSARLAKDGAQLAECLRRGEPLRASTALTRFPALVVWLLSSRQPQSVLVTALRHTAQGFHQQALLQADRMRLFLPICLVLLCGATAAALYAWLTFLPYTTLLRSLAAP